MTQWHWSRTIVGRGREERADKDRAPARHRRPAPARRRLAVPFGELVLGVAGKATSPDQAPLDRPPAPELAPSSPPAAPAPAPSGLPPRPEDDAPPPTDPSPSAA